MDEDLIRLNLDQERAAYQEKLKAEQEEREPDSTKPKSIGFLSFIILLGACVVADLVDIFSLGTIGWLFGLFVDMILLVFMGISRAGRKQFKRMIFGIAAETIPLPFLVVIPWRSVFLVWVYIKSKREGVSHRDSEDEEAYPKAA